MSKLAFTLIPPPVWFTILKLLLEHEHQITPYVGLQGNSCVGFLIHPIGAIWPTYFNPRCRHLFDPFRKKKRKKTRELQDITIA